MRNGIISWFLTPNEDISNVVEEATTMLMIKQTPGKDSIPQITGTTITLQRRNKMIDSGSKITTNI